MAVKSLLEEWKAILKNRKLLIPILAVMFIPILYSGMFLWAFWDPYDRLEDLPVAVVNEDRGAVFAGEEIKLGDDLVKKLKESKNFHFEFVRKEEGYKQLKNEKYYLLVEIPEDFSKNATTILDESPKKLELKYVPNEGYNFLSAQIGETAMERIKASLSEKISETYAESVFDKVSEMADGYRTASNNAGKLYAGISELNNGAKTMQEKLELLAKKQIEFSNGVSKIDSGTKELEKGAGQLASGLAKLHDAASKLENGANEINNGLSKALSGSSALQQGMNTAYTSMNEIVKGTEQIKAGSVSLEQNLQAWSKGAKDASVGAIQLNEGIANLQEQLKPYMAALPEEKQKELTAAFTQLLNGSAGLSQGTKELANGAEKLAGGSSQLAEKMDQLNEGQKKLQSGMEQLNAASGQLGAGLNKLHNGQQQFVDHFSMFGDKLGEASNGASKLAAGTGQLSFGTDQLKNGSLQLSSGAGQLADGSKKITDGSSKIESGAKQFNEKLGEAAEKASSVQPNDKTYDMMAQPVKVDKEGINEVPNYGTGFTPYFLSLGLFVGALLLSIVFPLREPALAPKNGFAWFTGKFGVMAFVGIVQALIASGILLLALKIEVKSVPLFILFSIFTSLAFIALIQFLVTCFGDPGRFMAIIVLILQLTTSAGTFPLELIPKQLQWFHSILPMTYSVKGFKAVISSGDYAVMWLNTGILVGFMAAFMILTLCYFLFKFKRTYFTLTKTNEVEA